MNTHSSNNPIPIITAPSLESLSNAPVDWLHTLKQASWIDIPGVDKSRCRVISTLLHGNEPSGLMALHRWLRLQVTPVVNLCFLVASVEAALDSPLFSKRMLAGQRDLNRCFREPYEEKQGLLAQKIIERIRQIKPECIIDIHNTSGTGPSFAVSPIDQFEQRTLARYFCRRMILTDFRLGSLMEVNEGCPTVTIECGGAKDSESENTAFNGIHEVSQVEHLFAHGADEGLETLYCPVRIVLNAGVTLDYHETALEHVDMTLWPDIEHCNYGITPTTTCLGWIGIGGLKLLSAKNASDVDQLHKLLREENGWLYPACDLHIFMATTNATIARDDCLFYAVAAT